MPFIFDNLFEVALGAGLASGATTLTLASGQGANLPAVAAPNVLLLVLYESGVGTEPVLVTAHTAGADTATVTRAYGSIGGATPTALTFTTAAKARASSAKEILDNFAQLDRANVYPIQTADPSNSSGLAVFPVTRAGREMLRMRGGATGDAATLQPHIGTNPIFLVRPGGAATLFSMGEALTTTNATLSTPTLATTDFSTASRRTRFTGATTVSLQVGWMIAVATEHFCTRQSGWHFVARFLVGTILPTGGKALFGLSTHTAQVTTAEPSAAQSGVWFGCDSGDANYGIVTSNAGTRTFTALTTPIAKNTLSGTAGAVQVTFYQAPGGSTIYARVENWVTGAVLLADTALAGNLPPTSALLRPAMWVNVGTVTAGTAPTWDLVTCYLETD